MNIKGAIQRSQEVRSNMKVCETCGKKFKIVHPSQINTKKYCSAPCSSGGSRYIRKQKPLDLS